MRIIGRWPGAAMLPAAAALLALSACGQANDGAPQDDAPQTAGNQAGPKPPPAFAVCRSCHAIEPGRGGSGPSLAGVWQRRAGTLPGYPYSAALKESGIVWDAKSLDTWLAAPMQMVPGTRMVYGIPDPQGRKAVIEYLRTLK